jgi:hypothetical protein
VDPAPDDQEPIGTLLRKSYGPVTGRISAARAARRAVVQDPLAELAGYFCRGTKAPDRELIRLAAAARAGGSDYLR